jgi:hypothetical protein
MKPIILLLALISLTAICSAQEVNGWEFLSWKMSKDIVEKILIENKSKLSDATALDADFKSQQMNTWLYYDKYNQLIKVHQRRAFSVIENREVEAFYDTVKTRMMTKFGEPTHSEIDKKDSVINLSWNFKLTKISLEYNYKYKIIDEFGADSYWLDILFEPAKAD